MTEHRTTTTTTTMKLPLQLFPRSTGVASPPKRTTTTTTKTARQHHHHHHHHNVVNVRHGILQSLQNRFPSLIPEAAQPTLIQSPFVDDAAATAVTSPLFSSSLSSSSSSTVFPTTTPPSTPLTTMTTTTNPLLYAATTLPLIVTDQTTNGIVSFFRFLFVFTLGGLFFTTALAGITACYAMGIDNVKRAINILNVVIQKVWDTFVVGLTTTKLALLGIDENEVDNDDLVDQLMTMTTKKKKKNSWNWKSAWKVLKEQLLVTKQTAVEGVQALRQEVHLYAAAVGIPGLIPIQYMLDRLMPDSIATMLEDTLRESLTDYSKQSSSSKGKRSKGSSSSSIQKMTLSSFTAGTRAPLLQAARAYDVDNVIAFDCDMKWDSQIEATVQIYTAGGLARVPISIKNIQFEGTIRIILTPLVKESPGYGATLISLPIPPKINLKVNVLGGELTKVPFLQREITQSMQKVISDQLLWPKRMIIPTILEPKTGRNKSNSKQSLLSRSELQTLETTDPLLQAEQILAEQTAEILKPVHDVVTDDNNTTTTVIVAGGIEDQTTNGHHISSSSSFLDHHHHYENYNNNGIVHGVLWERLQQWTI